jgi:N-acetylmuramoyl-L-alanine amidase
MAGSLRPGVTSNRMSVHAISVAWHGKQAVNALGRSVLVAGALAGNLLCTQAAFAQTQTQIQNQAQTDVPKSLPSATTAAQSGQSAQSGGAEFAKSKRADDHAGGSSRAGPDVLGSGSAVATAVRVLQRGARTLFELDVSRRVAMQVFALAGPPRVVIDVTDLEFALPAGIGQRGHGLVAAFRYGQFAPGRSRIVIDATTAVRVSRAEVVPGMSPQKARLQIEIETGTADPPAMAEAVQPGPVPAAIAGPPLSSSSPTKPAAGFIVMIDPGHGGVDGGASGGAQVIEKEIVLAVARQLKSALEAA